MNVKNEILEELQEMASPLAGVTRVMPFPVPNGYFEAFAGAIINNITCEPGNWVKQNPYTVPGSYFEELPGELLAENLITDKTELFPKNKPFEIPANYFETLPQQILQKAKADTQHRPTRTTVIKWRQSIRWAAAAVLVLGISIGSYRIVISQPLDTSKALAALPAGTINEYVSQNVDDFETELILNNLSAGKNINATGQLNEQDIVQYLNEEGWDVKTEVN